MNGSFSYGYEDTQESILRSLDFITKSHIDIVNTPIVIPSPGTPLYKKLHDQIEFKNYPLDWNKYLGRLVYSPRKVSKKEFYKAYLFSTKRINSIKEILKRGFYSLTWSRNFFQSLMIFLFNLGYRRLRRRGMSFLLEQDSDFELACEDLKRSYILD